jgi:serine phosphatase RsbU (regulator of sigma subunit)
MASITLDDLLDFVPAVIAVLRGPDHVVEYANPSFLEFAPAEHVRGRPIGELFPQPENQGLIDVLDRVYASGEPASGQEWRGVIGEGVVRWFDFAFVPVRDGVMLHAVEVSRLVEARREAELAADRTARLQRVTSALSAASSGEQVGAVVVDQAVAAFSAAAGALAFRQGDEVAMRHDRGFDDAAMAPYRRFPLAASTPIGDVLRTGEPVLLETLDDWERYHELRRRMTGQFPALAAVPLTFAGEVMGALVLCDDRPRAFTPRDRAFLAALADHAAQALERARLYEERAYIARTLQEGLLPERLAEIPGLEVAVRYHSIADGGTVGGDFYDCFDISPQRWLVAVGDVAGKGTAAAVLTGLARHTLRAIALREERPDDMLRFLNEALRRQSAEAAFCTVGCALLEPADGGGFHAVLASGGHPYPLLVRAGGRVEEVMVRGTLLGVEAAPVLEQVPLALRPGDTLVLYTDGVVDARDASGERYGEERLIAAVDRAAGGSADSVAAAVDEAVAAHEPERRRDDRAIAVLHVADR